MKIRACLMAGIFGIAVLAGVFEALASPRKREETEEKNKEEEGRAKDPGSGNCLMLLSYDLRHVGNIEIEKLQCIRDMYEH